MTPDLPESSEREGRTMTAAALTEPTAEIESGTGLAQPTDDQVAIAIVRARRALAASRSMREWQALPWCTRMWEWLRP